MGRLSFDHPLVVATVNMINPIDGLDGLAAGICLVAAELCHRLKLNQTAAAFLCACSLGQWPFLPYTRRPGFGQFRRSLGYLLGPLIERKTPTILPPVPVFALGCRFWILLGHLAALAARTRYPWRQGPPSPPPGRWASGNGGGASPLWTQSLWSRSFFLSRVPVFWKSLFSSE